MQQDDRLTDPLPHIHHPHTSHTSHPAAEEWRRRYPLFPRLLFVLDRTGPTGVKNRITALHAAAQDLTASPYLYDVPLLAAPLADLLQHSPSAPVWRPVHNPDQRADWTMDRRRPT
ncbi:hypothetical protein AB0F77_22955 [Streptomyces sp. NPDC026672]|uniref:hypothetical protein n=1 Tax=unclassified Streptomyces TaxID=2593676 RepID=UPI0033E71167